MNLLIILMVVVFICFIFSWLIILDRESKNRLYDLVRSFSYKYIKNGTK